MEIKPAVFLFYKMEEIAVATHRRGYRIACTVKYLLWGTRCADQEIMSVGAVFTYSRRMIFFFFFRKMEFSK